MVDGCWSSGGCCRRSFPSPLDRAGSGSGGGSGASRQSRGSSPIAKLFSRLSVWFGEWPCDQHGMTHCRPRGISGAFLREFLAGNGPILRPVRTGFPRERRLWRHPPCRQRPWWCKSMKGKTMSSKSVRIIAAGFSVCIVTAQVAAKAKQADFNGDGIADLACAARGERVSGHDAAGAVHVFYGKGGDGLSPYQVSTSATRWPLAISTTTASAILRSACPVTRSAASSAQARSTCYTDRPRA
jgi:hypothetical protein